MAGRGVGKRDSVAGESGQVPRGGTQVWLLRFVQHVPHEGCSFSSRFVANVLSQSIDTVSILLVHIRVLGHLCIYVFVHGEVQTDICFGTFDS